MSQFLTISAFSLSFSPVGSVALENSHTGNISKNVHNNIVYDSKKPETPQMALNSRKDIHIPKYSTME